MKSTIRRFDLAHLAHLELLSPKPEQEPRLLRQRHDGHDRDGAQGRLRLPAWLGRLRAPHAELTASKWPAWGISRSVSRAPEALQNRVGIIEKAGFGKGLTDGDSDMDRPPRSRRPTATTMEIYCWRPSGTRRPPPEAVVEEPGDAVSRTRRQRKGGVSIISTC